MTGTRQPAPGSGSDLSIEPSRTLVLGALGVIGRNVIEHLDVTGRPVLGMSRRSPSPEDPFSQIPHIAADITDRTTLESIGDELADVTHLVFAAYQEHPTLAAQVAPNVALLRSTLDALKTVGAPLRHVTLYQGHKYYGSHLGPFKTPAYETDPRLPGPNFYYDQEDLLRQRAQQENFHFTILRPEAVCGIATGNPMNLMTAIAVYATLCKHEKIPLRFPGPDLAADALYQVTDARLLARATAWAGTSPTARNEAFNMTNGDVFRWRHMFPRIAEHFGIPDAPSQTLKLAEHMPSHEHLWDQITTTSNIRRTRYSDMAAWDFADFIFHSTWDNVSSTVKIRQAGFADCIDTETMFTELFTELASRKLIPE